MRGERVTAPYLFMWLNEDNVEQYAAEHYTHSITSEDEFWEDYGRIKYIKRLFNKYRTSKTLKTNLIVNHLIILYNVFDNQALTRILFYKFNKYHSELVPFLAFLQQLPTRINNYTHDVPVLNVAAIQPDPIIAAELTAILRNG